MKGALLDRVGPHAVLLEISRPTFADQARTSTEVDRRRPPSWSKVPMLREAIEPLR